LRKLLIELLSIALIFGLVTAQSSITIQQIGGGGVGALFGYFACRNDSGVTSVISYPACILAVTTLFGIYTPVFLMIFLIIIFEALVRFDIVGNARRLMATFGSIASKGISLLPSPTSSNAFAFKLQEPLYNLININRAILYIGLFLVLITTVPFSLMFNISGSVLALLYEVTYDLVVILEPIFLSIVIVFVLISMMLDIAYVFKVGS
jgi:hypothetical protein